jgi:hypothetical protein
MRAWCGDGEAPELWALTTGDLSLPHRPKKSDRSSGDCVAPERCRHLPDFAPSIASTR